MLVLLCDNYWESKECRRELDSLLQRRAAGEAVAPYFVLAEPMSPQYLRLQPDGSHIGDVSRVGDFQFLGPFDNAQRLTALLQLEKWQWGQAFETMLARLKRELH